MDQHELQRRKERFEREQWMREQVCVCVYEHGGFTGASRHNSEPRYLSLRYIYHMDILTLVYSKSTIILITLIPPPPPKTCQKKKRSFDHNVVFFW